MFGDRLEEALRAEAVDWDVGFEICYYLIVHCGSLLDDVDVVLYGQREPDVSICGQRVVKADGRQLIA